MDFTERMERGRDAAAARRHKGRTTGKSAAGWNAKPRHDDEHSWHGVLFVVRQKWELARDHGIAVYATAVFPERYEDLPF